MINARELRIGNNFYAGIENHKHCTVLAIAQTGCDASYSDHSYGAPPLPPDGVHGLGFAKFDEMQPIFITPDILDKCGFEKADGYYSLHSGASSISIDDDLKTLIGANYGNDYALSHTIKYLHQLQNLFYSLCGTELEIKALATIRKNT